MDRKEAEPEERKRGKFIKGKSFEEETPSNSDTADGDDCMGQTPTGRRRKWKGRKKSIGSSSTCQSVNSCDSAKSDYSCQYLNADSYEKNVSLCRKCLFTYFEFNTVTNVIYMRHGARTPKKKIQNEWPFKEGKGDLTFLGFQQSVRIGKYLRKYYYTIRKLNSIYNNRRRGPSPGESSSHESDEEMNMMGGSPPWDQLKGHNIKGHKIEHVGRKKKNLNNLLKERRLKETIKLLVSKKSTDDDPCSMLHKRVTHRRGWPLFCHDRKKREPNALHVCTSVCANCCGNKKRNQMQIEVALPSIHPLDGGTPIGYVNKDAVDGACACDCNCDCDCACDCGCACNCRGRGDTLSSTCKANYFQKQMEKRINVEKQKRKYDKLVKIINNYLCIKTTSSERCKLTAYAIMCGILGITEKMFFFFFFLSFDNEEHDLLNADMMGASQMVSDHFRSVSGKREDRLHPISIPQTHLPNSNSILERRKSSLPAQVNFFPQQKDSSPHTQRNVRPGRGTHLEVCHPLGGLQGGSNHQVSFAPTFPNSICNLVDKDCEGNVHMGEQKQKQKKQMRDAAHNAMTRSDGSGSPDQVRHRSQWAGSDTRGGETASGGKCPPNCYSLFVEPPRHQCVSCSMAACTDEENTEGLDGSGKTGAKKGVKMGQKMGEAKLPFDVTSCGGDDPIVEKKKPQDENDKKRSNGHDGSWSKRSDVHTEAGANWMAENAQSYSDSVNPSWGVLKRRFAKGASRSGAARKGPDRFRPSTTLIQNVRTFFEFVLRGRYSSTIFYNQIMKAKGRSESKLEKACIFFIFESYMRYVLSDFPGYVNHSGGVANPTCAYRDAGHSSGHHDDGRFPSPACMASSYPRSYRRNLLSYLRNIYVLCSVVNVAERNSLMLKTLKSNNQYIKRLKNLIFYNSNVYKLLNDYYKEEVSIVYQITKWKNRTYLNRSELLLSEPWANITQSDAAQEDESNIKNRIVKILKKHNSAVYKIKKKLNKSIILKDLRKLNYYTVSVTSRDVPTCEQRKMMQERIKSMRNHLLFCSKRKNIKIIKQFISSYHSYVYHNVRLMLDMRKAYRSVEIECSSSSEIVLGVATPEMEKQEPPNGEDNCGLNERGSATRKAVAFHQGGDSRRSYQSVQRGAAEKWPHMEKLNGLDGRCAGDYSKGEGAHGQGEKRPNGSLDLCEATHDEPPDEPPDDPPDEARWAKRTDETAEKKEKNKAKKFYKKIYECYKHMCTLEYNNKYLSWLCSGMSLMDVVINFMISVRVYESFNREMATGWGGGKKFIPKIILYLTHQSSILSFQSCVGVKRSSMKIPPFGGFLSLELVHIRKKGKPDKARGRGKGHRYRKTSSKVPSEVSTHVHTALQMESNAKGEFEHLCGTHTLDQLPTVAAQGDLPFCNSTPLDEPTSRRQNQKVISEAKSADRHNVQTFIRANDTASIFCCKEDCVWKTKRGNGMSSQNGADGRPTHTRRAHSTATRARKKDAREDKYESYLPKCANKIHNFKNLFNLLCYKDKNVDSSNVDTLIQLYKLCLSDDCSYVGNADLHGGQEGQRRRRRHFYGYFVRFTFNHYCPLKLKRKKCIKKGVKKCTRGGDVEEKEKMNNRHANGHTNGRTNWQQIQEDPPGEVIHMEGRSPRGKVLPSVIGRADKRFDANEEKSHLETQKGKKETCQGGEFALKNKYKERKMDQSDDYGKGKHLRRNKIMKRLNMNSLNFDTKHDTYMHYVYNSSDLKYGKIYSKLNKESDSKFSTKKSVDINNRLVERSRVKLNGGGGTSFSSEESTHDEWELRSAKFKSLGKDEDAAEKQVDSVNCEVNDHLYHLKTNDVEGGQQNSTPMGYSFKLSKRAMSSRLLKNFMTDETEKRKRTKMQKMLQMQKTKPSFNRKKDERDKRNYQNENIICLDCLISYLRQMLRVYGNPEML
ncbi:hypothetical protein AK88_03820 [Plasmodium fragile]|uniref:Uncharacterized protein n=1 Tax=Plasmodium fragile TaxID=5857 RepID=A0A0D9QHM0_PLAFR|nr:uncharacterized protein AK88_03820 [Plasmodium fragile]KJP86529.1 hypothetical protein AK88_03820 [Plasmodium fragile]